jgi:hypothetical protein
MDTRLLRCISTAAAEECAAFLRGQGITDAATEGLYVTAVLDVPSMLRLAEDAFENGWANDEDCAALIPHAVVVFCDVCGVEERVEVAAPTREARLAAARARLNTQGWQCAADADLCPDDKRST